MSDSRSESVLSELISDCCTRDHAFGHNNKRPPEEGPDLAVVRAFVEHAFPLSISWALTDKLASLVAEMSVCWVQAGHNVLQVTAALQTQLAIEMPLEEIMDVLFAWEEVHKSRCMPETTKSPRREVVRSSASAGVIYPPFLGSFA